MGIGIVLWFLPAPAGLAVKAWRMFAVFVTTIAGIMTAPAHGGRRHHRRQGNHHGGNFPWLLVLWIFGEDLAIGATLAAALGVSLLFITGVLTWEDALNGKSAWDTMIWIGLLIMLASKLNEYGMVAWFGKEFGAHLEGFHRLAVYMLVAAIYCYAHYSFASATAHISALFPLSMALMVAAGIPPFTAAL
ncbi:anion permease [Cupriavidus necator]